MQGMSGVSSLHFPSVEVVVFYYLLATVSEKLDQLVLSASVRKKLGKMEEKHPKASIDGGDRSRLGPKMCDMIVVNI